MPQGTYVVCETCGAFAEDPGDDLRRYRCATCHGKALRRQFVPADARVAAPSDTSGHVVGGAAIGAALGGSVFGPVGAILGGLLGAFAAKGR